jgi:hypothetical protein
MKYFLFVTIFFIVSCESPVLDIQRGIPVDISKKTMTVPATGRVVFAIKRELRNAGWKLKIADDTLEEQQTSSKKKVTEVKYKTAYRLYFAKSGAATSVTIIENKTDEMVLELSARLYHHSMWADFGKTIVKELEKKE